MNSLQPTDGRRLATGTGLLLAVLVSVSLLGAAIVQWSRDSDITSTPLASNVVLSHDYGLWSYVATQEPSGLNVDLSYRYETVRELENYVAMNKGQVDTLVRAGGDVDVLVTFRWPVAPAVFREWVEEHGMKAEMASLRLSMPDGAHGTLTVGAREGDPLPEDALMGGMGSRSTILGVYSVRGKTPAGRLPAIASDRAVYLADVTPTLTRRDIAGANLPNAQNATINCISPFREMEALGLVPR